MDDRTLERDFAAFRERASLEALQRVFDRVAPELLGVARGLVADADAAEDLVQATFLTAIERRERWDSGRRLVPWLVGILTRHARAEQRRRAREPRVERCSERLAKAGLPAGEVEELHRELAHSLDRLPESQRAVAALYLRHDLTPAEIADALGRPASTVRSQLQRALASLRERLPRVLALALLAAPRGLEAVRAEVLARAESSIVPLPRPTSPIGGSTMIQLGALAVGLAAVALLVPTPSKPAATAPSGSGSLAAVSASPTHRPSSASRRRAVEHAVDRTASAPLDEPALESRFLPLWIEVRDPRGAPVEGAVIALASVKLAEEPDRVYGWRADVVAASTTSAEGQGQLLIPRVWERRHPSAVSFSVAHPEFAPFCSDFVELADSRVAVVLEWGAALRLTGRIEGGERVDAGRLQAELGVRSEVAPRDFRTAGAGTIETTGLAPGRHHVALRYVASGGSVYRSAMEAVEVAAGSVLERELVLVPVAKLRGRLSDQVPRPVVGGEVILHQSSTGERLLARTLRARVAPDGTFEVGDLGPGAVEVAVLCDGFASATRSPDEPATEGPWFEGVRNPAVVVEGPYAELEVPMVATAEVLLDCEDPEGRPVVELDVWTRVLVRWRDGRWQYFENPPHGVTDSEGRLLLTRVPPGEHSLSGLHPDWRFPSEREHVSEVVIPGGPLAAGERRAVTLELVARVVQTVPGRN